MLDAETNVKKGDIGGDSRGRTRSSVDGEVNAGLRSGRVEVAAPEDIVLAARTHSNQSFHVSCKL